MAALNRRWFQWSLRTLFVVLTVFGLWLGYELNWIRQRRDALANGWCGIVGEKAPGQLWLFGEDGYIAVYKPGGLSPDDRPNVPHIMSLFPEANVK